MKDKTIYIKTMCDYNACALEGTEACQQCVKRELDKRSKDSYDEFEGKVLLVGPDLTD